jgi:hypothetical protein
VRNKNALLADDFSTQSTPTLHHARATHPPDSREHYGPGVRFLTGRGNSPAIPAATSPTSTISATGWPRMPGGSLAVRGDRLGGRGVFPDARHPGGDMGLRVPAAFRHGSIGGYSCGTLALMSARFIVAFRPCRSHACRQFPQPLRDGCRCSGRWARFLPACCPF